MRTFALLLSLSTAAYCAGVPYFSEPTLCPTRPEIAFVSGGDIWVVPSKGGEAHLLVSDPAEESRPLYSPDGAKLAFVSTRTGGGDIYILTLASGDLKRLTFDDRLDQLDSWSRDGRWIYFSNGTNDVGNKNDLYRVSAEGGTPMPVSADRFTNEFQAAPAPDGSTVAFAARGNGDAQWWRHGHSHLDESEIWLRKDGAPATYEKIVDLDGRNAWPMWMPDGKSIYFMSDRSGAQNLWTLPLGGKMKQVTKFNDGRVIWPSIGYDGKAVVFERDFKIWQLDTRSGEAYAIPITLVGSVPTPEITHLSLNSFNDLALSADGRKVALIAHGEVFASSAHDGGQAFRVTHTPGPETQVAWAPDSTRLAYLSERDAVTHVFLYDFAHHTETQLTKDAQPDRTIKRADNHGEGGILALMSLVGANGFTRGFALLTGMGLLGAALIYGDGVITPAISVLSALEGVNVATDALKPFVMPMAVVVLLCLFGAQRFGTEKIGRAFGPVMMLWFIVIAALGVVAIARHPGVVAALDPRYAVHFMLKSGRSGFFVLGGVFLAITGGEALYADMGHFGKGPIRCSWYLIVLPSLLLSYAGQTAYLIDAGAVTGNPFFQMAPAWSIYPLVVLATLATIIASQAIITGSFSMTRQAMQLGWLPGVSIRQTSDRIYGQIYVPVVNWLLMLATIATTVAFRSSDRLAGAYGTAVSTTMLLTTLLLYRAMRGVWRWPAPVAIVVAGIFLIVDVSFFAANLLKIADGGWLPLTFAALLFLVMTTWRRGVEAVHAMLAQPPEAGERFLSDLKNGVIPRVDGTTVFLTRTGTQRVSGLVIAHAHYAGVLPRNAIALSVLFENTPRIIGPTCSVVDHTGEGLWQVVARFGFFEIPDLRQALMRAHGLESVVDFDKALFVATRDLVVQKHQDSSLMAWRLALFAFLYRNSVKVVDRFNLAPENVLEIARQIEI